MISFWTVRASRKCVHTVGRGVLWRDIPSRQGDAVGRRAVLESLSSPRPAAGRCGRWPPDIRPLSAGDVVRQAHIQAADSFIPVVRQSFPPVIPKRSAELGSVPPVLGVRPHADADAMFGVVVNFHPVGTPLASVPLQRSAPAGGRQAFSMRSFPAVPQEGGRIVRRHELRDGVGIMSFSRSLSIRRW